MNPCKRQVEKRRNELYYHDSERCSVHNNVEHNTQNPNEHTSVMVTVESSQSDTGHGSNEDNYA